MQRPKTHSTEPTLQASDDCGFQLLPLDQSQKPSGEKLFIPLPIPRATQSFSIAYRFLVLCLRSVLVLSNVLCDGSLATPPLMRERKQRGGSVKPIFKLCYDYLMQGLLWDSPQERPECWVMSVLGEEQTPDQSVPGSVCLQSVPLPSAGLWDGSTHTEPEAPSGMAPKLSRTSPG